VALPNLRGVSAADAQKALTDLGLTPAVRNQVDTSVPVGFVIGTDPPAGSSVQAGSTVTLLVATAPPTSASAPPSRSASPSPTR
jgi:serine/threonine-protein kinase